MAAGVLAARQLAAPAVAETTYIEVTPQRRSITNVFSESGTLFADVGSQDALAPYIRIAVGQGWMSGYSDGTFRPDQA